jgi:ABC-type nitrate/sulfonate/bicarbonate transport system substrate-binding protein
VTRPDVTRPEDLRGQRLGVSRLGSATHFALRAALQQWGLDPERDAAVVQMGGVPEIRAGLESGAIVGGTLSLPTLAQARRAGFRELLDLASLSVEYQTTGVVAAAPFLEEQRPAATGIVRALAEALRVFKTDRATTVAVLRALIQEDDEQILEETYERYGQRYLVQIPYPSRAGVLAAQEQMLTGDARLATLTVDDIVDDRIVQALDAEGFFTRLYSPR